MKKVELQKDINQRVKIIGPIEFRASDKIDLECKDCGHIWKAKPINLKYAKSGCPECWRLRRGEAQSKNHDIYVKELLAKFGNKVKCIGKYQKALVPIKHVCSKGHEFVQLPNRVLSAKSQPCSVCSYSDRNARHKISKEDAETRLRVNHEDRFSLLIFDGYTASRSKFKCLDCRHVFTASVGRLAGTKTGYGCLVCSRRKFLSTNAFKPKKYKLGRRDILVQGYEPFALDLIKKHVKASHIKAGGDAEIPRILFKFLGKTRTYLPDIFVPTLNTLVEVKSTRSFGLWDELLFRKNQAKARACIKQGYRFVMMLFLSEGYRVSLPVNWYNKSLTSLKLYLEEKEGL